MDIKIKVGIRIRELRMKNSLTQEQLGFKVNVDRTYINSVENGKRNISVKVLEQIITGFDINMYDFFNSNIFKEN